MRGRHRSVGRDATNLVALPSCHAAAASACCRSATLPSGVLPIPPRSEQPHRVRREAGSLGLAVAVLQGPTSPRAWWRLTVGGAVALTLSQPAIFVLAGVGCCPSRARRRPPDPGRGPPLGRLSSLAPQPPPRRRACGTGSRSPLTRLGFACLRSDRLQARAIPWAVRSTAVKTCVADVAKRPSTCTRSGWGKGASARKRMANRPSAGWNVISRSWKPNVLLHQGARHLYAASFALKISFGQSVESGGATSRLHSRSCAEQISLTTSGPSGCARSTSTPIPQITPARAPRHRRTRRSV